MSTSSRPRSGSGVGGPQPPTPQPPPLPTPTPPKCHATVSSIFILFSPFRFLSFVSPAHPLGRPLPSGPPGGGGEGGGSIRTVRRASIHGPCRCLRLIPCVFQLAPTPRRGTRVLIKLLLCFNFVFLSPGSAAALRQESEDARWRLINSHRLIMRPIIVIRSAGGAASRRTVEPKRWTRCRNFKSVYCCARAKRRTSIRMLPNLLENIFIFHKSHAVRFPVVWETGKVREFTVTGKSQGIHEGFMKVKNYGVLMAKSS